MNYLAHYGVDRDEVLPAPAAMAILAHLFNAYPEAVEDDFAQRWTVHAVSRNIQLARKRTFLRDVARSTSYRRACEVLADIVPGPMSPFPVERLDYVEVKGGHYGSGGLLYAMASAAGINGTVRDLAQQDSLFWPDSRMRLHPLCLDAERGLVTHHALMSEQSAEILRAYGGWTVKAYEELRCGDALLRAHQLPVPDPAVRPENFADWLTSKRRPLIAAMIDDFQRGVGSLVDHPEDALTLPLGDAA
jgi:hypothetical protein